jgi:uncharacterized protein
MPYFVLIYDAGENFIERRTPYRAEHLKMAEEAHRRGELVLAGALAEPPDGALLVFRGEDGRAATHFAENDPYVRNGLVKQWRVRPWTVVVGGDTGAHTRGA